MFGFIPCLLFLYWRDKHQEKRVVCRFLDYIKWRRTIIQKVLSEEARKGISYSQAVYKYLGEHD